MPDSGGQDMDLSIVKIEAAVSKEQHDIGDLNMYINSGGEVPMVLHGKPPDGDGTGEASDGEYEDWSRDDMDGNDSQMKGGCSLYSQAVYRVECIGFDAVGELLA